MGCELLQRPPRRARFGGRPQEVPEQHEDTGDCGSGAPSSHGGEVAGGPPKPQTEQLHSAPS